MKVGYLVSMLRNGVSLEEQFPEKCLADAYADSLRSRGWKCNVSEFVYE